MELAGIGRERRSASIARLLWPHLFCAKRIAIGLSASILKVNVEDAFVLSPVKQEKAKKNPNNAYE